MNQDHTEIVIILDRSGSMSRIRQDMEGGLNQVFADQRMAPGRATVTFAQFDTVYELLYTGKDVNEVPPVELVPRGQTALYDAVGKTIVTVGLRLAETAEEKRPGRVLVLIITDGHENASREFTSDAIRTMIEEQRTKYSWEFVYLGANQNAALTGRTMGVAVTADYTATPAGTDDLVRRMSAGTRRYRQGGGYKHGE